MKRNSLTFEMLLAVLLLVPALALAGPPLLCFPFDIGNAKSLAWAGAPGTRAWDTPSPNYDTSRLPGDTVALLDAGAPVIVHMETLRRAAVYARHDPAAGERLLARLRDRASQARGAQSAIAQFDYGYLAEAYKEAFDAQRLRDAAKDIDGYTLVTRASATRGFDPQMEFAAAIIASSLRRDTRFEHARKAKVALASDSLLSRNWSAHISDQKPSLADARQ